MSQIRIAAEEILLQANGVVLFALLAGFVTVSFVRLARRKKTGIYRWVCWGVIAAVYLATLGICLLAGTFELQAGFMLLAFLVGILVGDRYARHRAQSDV